jgi:hypothetical protein
MIFHVLGLPADKFTHFFALSDSELAAQGGVRRTLDGKYPCRVASLIREPGKELLLINYEHHPVNSPHRMQFAIFLRDGDRTYEGQRRS